MNNTAQDIFNHCPLCGSPRFLPQTPKSRLCHECGFEFFTNPAAAVAAFIRNERGQLLLCRRAKEPCQGTWDLPGGFADIGESAEDALRRELKEELGVEISDIHYLFSIPNTYEYSHLEIPTLDLFYECRIAPSSEIHCEDDVENCQFIPLDQVKPETIGLHSIREAVKKFINDNKNKQI